MTEKQITCIVTRHAASRTYHAGRTLRRTDAGGVSHTPVSHALCGVAVGVMLPFMPALPFFAIRERGEATCPKCFGIACQEAADAACAAG